MTTPADYDTAISDLMKAGLPSATLQLAVNALRTERTALEVKLSKKAARLA